MNPIPNSFGQYCSIKQALAAFLALRSRILEVFSMLKCIILCEGCSQSRDQRCTVWQTFPHLSLPLNSDVLITDKSSLEVTLGPLLWKEPIKESPIQVRFPHDVWDVSVDWSLTYLMHSIFLKSCKALNRTPLEVYAASSTIFVIYSKAKINCLTNPFPHEALTAFH